MDPTSGYAMSFPVFHAQRREDGVFLIQGEIRGTALALGAEYMLTAGHVMEEMPSSESDVAVAGIAHPELGLKGAFVVNFELLGSDLALL